MSEIRTNQVFVTEVLKTAIDFNSQIISVATVELAGEQSGRNRTHQRKVLSDLQILGHNYNRNLEAMYQQREAELRGEDAKNELSDDLRSTIRKTVEFLDSKMKIAPNRELADTSNYLETLLQNDDFPADDKKEEKAEVKKS